ncbi:hypothetical protein IscW_ISCW023206 [Ixodes scapularis]|uniref:PHD-type domain-containing protein n=1 Tax=Ixodes scapularis TaxID=6945 RepID=B7QM40_IXOSC|nr:hypothetical protein IscW_ISCW023206 [Ixodes scapularis]|eukprot:XP_002416245.1 hypothetical protein IscW_ISCW023206 [Ixodes scapularis]
MTTSMPSGMGPNTVSNAGPGMGQNMGPNMGPGMAPNMGAMGSAAPQQHIISVSTSGGGMAPLGGPPQSPMPPPSSPMGGPSPSPRMQQPPTSPLPVPSPLLSQMSPQLPSPRTPRPPNTHPLSQLQQQHQMQQMLIKREDGSLGVPHGLRMSPHMAPRPFQQHEQQQHILLHPRFPGQPQMPRYLIRQGSDPASQHPPGHPYLQRTGGVHPMMRPPPPYPDHLRKPPPSPAMSPGHGPDGGDNPDPSRTPPSLSRPNSQPALPSPDPRSSPMERHFSPGTPSSSSSLPQRSPAVPTSLADDARGDVGERSVESLSDLLSRVSKTPSESPSPQSRGEEGRPSTGEPSPGRGCGSQDNSGQTPPLSKQESILQYLRAGSVGSPASNSNSSRGSVDSFAGVAGGQAMCSVAESRATESPHYVPASVYQSAGASPVGSPSPSAFAAQSQSMSTGDAFASDGSDSSSPMQVRTQMVRVSQGMMGLPTTTYVQQIRQQQQQMMLQQSQYVPQQGMAIRRPPAQSPRGSVPFGDSQFVRAQMFRAAAPANANVARNFVVRPGGNNPPGSGGGLRGGRPHTVGGGRGAVPASPPKASSSSGDEGEGASSTPSLLHRAGEGGSSSFGGSTFHVGPSSTLVSFETEQMQTSVFVSLDYPAATITSHDGLRLDEEDGDASRVALVMVGDGDGGQPDAVEHGEPLDVAVVVETVGALSDCDPGDDGSSPGGSDGADGMAPPGCGELHQRGTPAGDHNYSNPPPEGADEDVAKKLVGRTQFFDGVDVGIKLEDSVLGCISEEKPNIEKLLSERITPPQRASKTPSPPAAPVATSAMSFPASVTHTLNFTLRQTGMPQTVRLSNDEGQLVVLPGKAMATQLSLSPPAVACEPPVTPKMEPASALTPPAMLRVHAALAAPPSSACGSHAAGLRWCRTPPEVKEEGTPSVPPTPPPALPPVVVKQEARSTPSPCLAACHKQESEDVEEGSVEAADTGASRLTDGAAVPRTESNSCDDGVPPEQRLALPVTPPVATPTLPVALMAKDTAAALAAVKVEPTVAAVAVSEAQAGAAEEASAPKACEGSVEGPDGPTGGKQNVLLKQLLQNCPSAETPHVADLPEGAPTVQTACSGKSENGTGELSQTASLSPSLPSSPSSQPATTTAETAVTTTAVPASAPVNELDVPATTVGTPESQTVVGVAGTQAGATTTPDTDKPEESKGSRGGPEEDYELFLEALLGRLRALPPVRILEPLIRPNFNVGVVFGRGDLNLRESSLKGSYGRAFLPGQPDAYSVCPFGDRPPPPVAPSSAATPSPTPLRGFYNQEFSVHARVTSGGADSNRCREADSPDTIVGASSPECAMFEAPFRFRGLQLIDEDSNDSARSLPSPTVPIVAPIPVKDEKTKEIAFSGDRLPCFSRLAGCGGLLRQTLRDSPNVSVTLTLSSEAATDIRGVLCFLVKLAADRAPVELRHRGAHEHPSPARSWGSTSTEATVVCHAGRGDHPCREAPDSSRDRLARGVAAAREVVRALGEDDEASPAPKEEEGEEEEEEEEGRLLGDLEGSPASEELRKRAPKHSLALHREQLLDAQDICVKPDKPVEDTRRCILCHVVGDGETNGPARLLNLDVDMWVHLNCALWSQEVYETVNGALMNVASACRRAVLLTCCCCQRTGASLRCFRLRCTAAYHFPCAAKDGCSFFKDKTILCPQHTPRVPNLENVLESVAVFRRVYINRDEHKQVASMIHKGEQNLLRVGSLIFLSVGQLLPHQLQNFHTPNCIYPVGFKVVRIYWSMHKLGARSRYTCSIHDVDGQPQFQVRVSSGGHEKILSHRTPKGVWQKVLQPIENFRREAQAIKVFSNFITGEDLFGLTEPAIVRITESLPGVDTLNDYNFRYGRSPLLELPLAINPTGCARSEPKLRTHFKSTEADTAGVHG